MAAFTHAIPWRKTSRKVAKQNCSKTLTTDLGPWKMELCSYPSGIVHKTSLFLQSKDYCNPLEITMTPPSFFRSEINLNFLRILVKNTRFSIAFLQFASCAAILTCGVMKSWQNGSIWLVQRQSLFSPSIVNKGTKGTFVCACAKK